MSLRMQAHYFSFTPTGVEAIDRILSAVASAGKDYHHTEGWCHSITAYRPFRGGSYVDFIQNAANDAADKIRKATS